MNSDSQSADGARPHAHGRPEWRVTTTDALINQYVRASFRDIADKDYIAARICHRHGLEQQFLWFAQQAMEKYLKAILLFNRRDTRQLGHRVSRALTAVLAIPDIPFDLPDDVRAFVDYLDEQGCNRYFEYPFYVPGDVCLQLDRSVWAVRRYCYNMRRELVQPDGSVLQMLPREIAIIERETSLDRPHKYRLWAGLLEGVLSDKGSTLRSQLVWKNFYYGTYKKQVIANYRDRSVAGNPTHFLHPEVFDELEGLVQFSKPVLEHFAEQRRDGRR